MSASVRHQTKTSELNTRCFVPPSVKINLPERLFQHASLVKILDDLANHVEQVLQGRLLRALQTAGSECFFVVNKNHCLEVVHRDRASEDGVARLDWAFFRRTRLGVVDQDWVADSEVR